MADKFAGLIGAVAGEGPDAAELRRLASLSPSRQVTPEFLASLAEDGTPAACLLAERLPLLDGSPEGFLALPKEVQRSVLLLSVGLPDRTPCEAAIFHGPGHQSKTECDRLGPHEVHHADPMGYDLYWRGEEDCTDSGDDSPLDEDEYWADRHGKG